MLTTTLILPEDFSNTPIDKKTARVLIRDLEQYSLLLTTSAEIHSFEQILPTQEFAYLKERIKQGHIRCRFRTDAGREAELFSEVRVSSTGDVVEPAQWAAAVDELSDAPPVQTRRQIREGLTSISTREEFWSYLFSPMLRAMPRSKSRVEVVDTYLVEDFLRYTRSRTAPESGLGWLIRSMSEFSVSSRQDLCVSIFTAVTEENEVSGFRSISDAFDSLSHLISPGLTIQVAAVPRRRLKGEVRDAMHNRRIVTPASNGSLIYLGLDRGVSDLNLPASGATIRACSTFSYLPFVSPGSERHDLRAIDASIPTSCRLTLARPS